MNRSNEVVKCWEGRGRGYKFLQIIPFRLAMARLQTQTDIFSWPSSVRKVS